jgi:transposase-like protein
MVVNSAINGFFKRSLEKGESTKCKFCGSKNAVKYGQYQGIRRYFCKDCKRKFADNDASPHMKTPASHVASALNLFYERKSICTIRRHIEQQFKNYPSNSTIYRWVVRFTKIAIEKTKACRPTTGRVWIAAETPLKINGERWWIWDIIDSRTRFLLASYVLQVRTAQRAQMLMAQAAEKASKFPRRVITNTLETYLSSIQYAGLIIKSSKDMTERVSKPLKYRIGIMQRVKKVKASRLLLDGCLVHYNFIKPHEDLNYRTPAEKARVNLPFNSWLSMVTEDSFSKHD